MKIKFHIFFLYLFLYNSILLGQGVNISPKNNCKNCHRNNNYSVNTDPFFSLKTGTEIEANKHKPVKGLFMPAGIFTQFGPEGGTITDLKRIPGDENILFAVNFCGGIYKSADRGENWTKTFLWNFDIRVSPVNNNWVISRSNPDNIVFALSPYSTSSGGYYKYMFKTLDCGETWTRINLNDYPQFKNYTHLSCLVGDSENNLVISLSGIWKSADFGKSWIKMQTALFGSDITSFLMFSDSVMFLGNNAGLYRSDNSGESWARKTGGMTARKISVLDITAENSPAIYLGTKNDGTFKSVDGGFSWINSFAVEALSVAVDKPSKNTVYITVPG